MSDHIQEVLKIRLDKLFNGQSYFSISDVNELGKMLGTNPKLRPNYELLKNLHCVDYASMSDQLILDLPGMVASVLSTKVDAELLAQAISSNVSVPDVVKIVEEKEELGSSKKFLGFLG